MDNRFDFDTPHYESPEQEQADIRSWLADEDAQKKQRKRIAAIKVNVDEAVKTIRSMRLESGERDLIKHFLGVMSIEYANTMRSLDYRLYATFSDEKHPFCCDDPRHQPIATEHVNDAIREVCERLGYTFDSSGDINESKLAEVMKIARKTAGTLIESPEKSTKETADKLCAIVGKTCEEILGISEADIIEGMESSIDYLLGVDVMSPGEVLALYMKADDDTRRMVTMTLKKELMLQLCTMRE